MTRKEEFEKLNLKNCRLRKKITHRFGENEDGYIVEIDEALIQYTKQEFNKLFWPENENNSKNNPILDEIPEVYVRKEE